MPHFVGPALEAAHARQRAAAPGRLRHHQGHVFFGAGSAIFQDAFGAFHRQRQHFGRVAVVDLQDLGAALGFDPQPGKAEFAAGLLVDRLRVVVQHQQRLGGRVHHLRGSGQPMIGQVVRFIDQQGGILALGHACRCDPITGDARQGFVVVVGQLAASDGSELVGADQVQRPGMEGAHLNRRPHALEAQHRVDALGQFPVVAKHQDGLVRAGDGLQLHRTEDQDHGLARPGRSMDQPMAFAQVARDRLLLQIHHLQHVLHHQLGRRVVEVDRLLHAHAQFRKEQAAHDVHLRQGQRALPLHAEHAPQLLLESHGIHRVCQVIGQHHLVRLKDIGEAGVA